ncbi:nitrilase-related carbon-nitrogen hydrolase [Crassaminicella profunda]|uniref:nitrilase-related carbon-nitrogen hydrolase n=1 Tax=Crassaminicella profunda TaxID=1286698 RepID=UPI001CA755C9|nr:nitrilase-related carbon-nitrogen hydrolase [Crassaminicella profunda]QZY54302.1 carbon-nitrogen family hydrolase [Crassaminicella profunda]
MRIALCQLDIKWEDKETNREKVIAFIGQANKSNVEIILFPEMTLTGFSMNTELTGESNEETVNFFKEIAKSYNIAIGFGWVENTAHKAKNHYTVISREGNVLSDYVKIHPFSYGDENKFFESGNKLVKFDMKDFRIATFICYDLRFPEIFQAVSNDVDMIVIGANWPKARKEHWKALLKARAIENQTYIAGINCVGEKKGLVYSGNTCLYNPEGNLINEIEDEENIIIYDIDVRNVKEYRAHFPLKKDRKVDLYKKNL